MSIELKEKTIVLKFGENIYKVSSRMLECEFIKVCVENNKDNEIIEIDVNYEEAFKIIRNGSIKIIYKKVDDAISAEGYIKINKAQIEEIEKLYQKILYFGHSRFNDNIIREICKTILLKYMRLFIVKHRMGVCVKCKKSKNTNVYESKCTSINCGNVIYFSDWIKTSDIYDLEFFSFDKQWKQDIENCIKYQKSWCY